MFVSVVAAYFQANVWYQMIPDQPLLAAILSIIIGVGVGVLFGVLQGYIIAYLRVPAFIVTLGSMFILLAPVVSEKSYGLLDANKYTFLVRPDANKTEIKIAVEKVFNVKVTSVNTINRQGKTRRTRNGLGKRKDTKRAIVSLAEGHRIDIFGGPVS